MPSGSWLACTIARGEAGSRSRRRRERHRPRAPSSTSSSTSSRAVTRSARIPSARCSLRSIRPRTCARSSRTSYGVIAAEHHAEDREPEAVRRRNPRAARYVRDRVAGTGKTYLAMALAVSALSEGTVGRVILTRPAVESGRAARLSPRRHACENRPVSPTAVRRALRRSILSGWPEYMGAGRSRWRRSRSCVVGRSTTRSSCSTRPRTRRPSRCRMFLTRLGFGSRMVVTGDVTRIDLPREQASGLIQVRDILAGIGAIGFVEFGNEDVVRHKLSCSGSSRRTSATPRETGTATPVIVVETTNRSGGGGGGRGRRARAAVLRRRGSSTESSGSHSSGRTRCAT